MVGKRVVLLALVAGCGRIAFDPTSDAGTSDSSPDAAPPNGPFGTPIALTDVNSGVDDDDPTLSPDNLELIFDSEVGGVPGNLYVSRRASLTSPWSTPIVIAELATPSDDEDGPFLTADGLTLYFSSNRGGSLGSDDIFVTERASLSSPWQAPQNVAGVNTASSEQGFTVTADGLLAVFASYRGSADGNLYTASRTSVVAAFSNVQPIAELNTTSEDIEPTLSLDGLTLWFTSNRGAAGYDIWMSTRPSRSSPWGTPTLASELDSTGDDTDPYLSVDGHIMVFTRGTSSTRDIYLATR